MAIGKIFELDRGFSQCRVLSRVSGSVIMHIGVPAHIAALAPYKVPPANIVNIKASKSSRGVIPRSPSSAQLYSKCSELRSLGLEMVRHSCHPAPVWGRSHLPGSQASCAPTAALVPRVRCLILILQVVKRPWKSRLRLITKMEEYCDR